MNNFIYKWIFRTYRRICNIAAYAIQGAKTEDWDYEYFLNDIKFKINRMKIYLRKEGIVSKNILNSMEWVIKDLDYWRYTDFHEKYEKQLFKKYGKIIHKLTGKTSYYLIREKETSENSEQVEKEEYIAYLKAHVDELRAKNTFFQSLQSFIETWWS